MPGCGSAARVGATLDDGGEDAIDVGGGNKGRGALDQRDHIHLGAAFLPNIQSVQHRRLGGGGISRNVGGARDHFGASLACLCGNGLVIGADPHRFDLFCGQGSIDGPTQQRTSGDGF